MKRKYITAILALLALSVMAGAEIFQDGFESGDLNAWGGSCSL